MHFILDCDGVLLDWLTPFTEFAKGLGYDPDPRGPEDFDLHDWLGCPTHRAASLIRVFNDSPAFCDLKPVAGAVMFVEALKAAGHTASILTAAGVKMDLRRQRVANIERCFGEDAFSEITFLPLGESKFSTLYKASKQRDDLVFIDDHFLHASSAAVNGIKSYCKSMSYNRQFTTRETEVKFFDYFEEIVVDLFSTIQHKVE